jgi:hypothetical protein
MWIPLWFLIGLWVGGMGGMLMMAVLIAGSRADEVMGDE